MPKPSTRSMSMTSQESYSAVIIADMVAEVQTDDAPPNCGDTAMAPADRMTLNRQVNPAFDDDQPDLNPPAVVRVDAMGTVDVGRSLRTNGATDISKGVILNATQFSLTPDSLKQVKPIEMTPVPEIRQNGAKGVPASLEPPGEMTIPRKIAFVFSFLPSIMFVLCFAVILPCKDSLPPCVTEMWFKTFPNDTDVTSRLFVPGNVVYTSLAPGGSIMSGLHQDTGNLVWNHTLHSLTSLIGCGHLAKSDHRACFVVEDTGVFLMINESDGAIVWFEPLKRTVEASGSAPIILPDCNGDGIDEIAFVANKTSIKILFKGSFIHLVEIPNCDSVPVRLTAWKKSSNNETDLLFVCRHAAVEKLVRIPQSKWCQYGNAEKKKEELSSLESGKPGSFAHSTLLPTEDGLAVWAEDHVTMFGNGGGQRWKATSQNHTSTDRFLLYVKINETSKQLVLFSSDFPNRLVITYLRGDNGEIVRTTIVQRAEISDVLLLHGKERDFALLYLKQVEEGDWKSEAMSKIDGVATTIVSTLTTEEVHRSAPNNVSDSARIQEKIILLDFGDTSGNQTIYTSDMKYAEAEPYRSTLTVSQGKVDMAIFVLRKPKHHPEGLETQVKRINVANWDVGKSQCSWKQ